MFYTDSVSPSEQALFSCVLPHDFPSFIAKSFATVDPGATYLPNWHIDLIAEYLEAARRGELQRLIINMPPRSLKSIIASVAWPAFILGHNPSARVMAASYASGLSLKHSLDCRLVMNTPWYRRVFRGTRLSRDQNEKHKFITTERGYRFATSVGGTATGEGGNFLIVDDPLNPLQASSALMRQTVNDWFDHTFATRLDDKHRGVIVLVMQRLHMDDLSGYLLAKGGWEHLCLPAIAPEEKTIRFGSLSMLRPAGDILHPGRENDALMERAKRELGSYAFAAQYQQQPRPAEGGMIKLHWLKRYTHLPEAPLRVVQSWDTAIKTHKHNDASACVTIVEGTDGHYVAELHVLRAEYPELKRTMLQIAERWRPDAILIEDKASGQSLLQDLRRETSLPLIPVMPKGDKVTRLAAVSPLIEAGRLWLPEHARWLGDFEEELLAFPQGAHDDQVDALSQYLQWAKARAGERMQIRSF